MYARPDRPMQYDRDGTPIDVETWIRLRSDDTYWRIARDDDVETPDGRQFDVSTIWLGMDVDPWSAQPLIFESMVFRCGSFAGEYQTRYPTLEQARTGHAVIVHILTTGTMPLHEIGHDA